MYALCIHLYFMVRPIRPTKSRLWGGTSAGWELFGPGEIARKGLSKNPGGGDFAKGGTVRIRR